MGLIPCNSSLILQKHRPDFLISQSIIYLSKEWQKRSYTEAPRVKQPTQKHDLGPKQKRKGWIQPESESGKFERHVSTKISEISEKTILNK